MLGKLAGAGAGAGAGVPMFTFHLTSGPVPFCGCRVSCPPYTEHAICVDIRDRLCVLQVSRAHRLVVRAAFRRQLRPRHRHRPSGCWQRLSVPAQGAMGGALLTAPRPWVTCVCPLSSPTQLASSTLDAAVANAAVAGAGSSGLAVAASTVSDVPPSPLTSFTQQWSGVDGAVLTYGLCTLPCLPLLGARGG